MIISDKTMELTKLKLDKLLIAAGEPKKSEIERRLDTLSKDYDSDVADCVKWLIANSPLSDLGNYDFDMFVSFAEHGVFLKENSPFLKDVSEDIFLNFVLHTRVGGEEICDCRKFFYDKLIDRINRLNMHDAIIEVNYYNAENVKYISTDYRTLCAIATYNSGFGRCGEESVFAVNVFRALGIPSRQAMTPRWAHCDDNHAWVEVWEGGRWHFLGACEPEEVLDKGWFTNASGRAMMISTPCFGDVPSGTEVMYMSGFVSIINVLDTYAVTKKITVAVTDEQGKPVSGARVLFGILNLCHIFPGAIMTTDDEGKVSLTCGYGSLNVRIEKDDIFFERMIFTPTSDVFEFVLKREQPRYDVWEDFVAIAPADGKPKGNKPTEEQKELCLQKTKAANRKRDAREKAMFDLSRAKKVVSKWGFGTKVLDIIKESYGHADKIYEFLEDERFTAEQKEKILLTLSEKDWRDVNIEVLSEALLFSCNKNAYDDDLFYKYVVCPRVWHEPLWKCREFIRNYFSDEQKRRFVLDPKLIWEYVNKFTFDPSLEYGLGFTRPTGVLTLNKANETSKKILFVSICRALDIPARLNPVSLLAEYYDGDFIAVEKADEGDCTLTFIKEEGESYAYMADFAVGMLLGADYQTLEIDDDWKDNAITVKVKSGEYRIITDNRLPNGNLHASKYHFKLLSGEHKAIKLHKFGANLGEMLYEYKVDDFTVMREDGSVQRGSELDAPIMMWLSEGTEPTEHILNEMLENKDEFKHLDVIFMVKGKESLKNEKLKKVLETFDGIQVRYDTFDPNVEVLARRLFLDPEKLPLIVVFGKPLTAVYACSGYNVGSGKMIVEICRYLNKQKR